MKMGKIFKESEDSKIKKYGKIVSEINSLESKYEKFSDEDLKKETNNLKQRISDGEKTDDILAPAFALVREASKRTLNMRHYDVQLIGGIVLHKSGIAEMRTGEGKTLVATLPVFLNALTGKGVHVVTVNDYLSSRDASWMGQVYNFLGLSVGVLNSQNTSYIYDPNHFSSKEEEEVKDEERDETGSFKVSYDFLRPATKKEAYNCDITYGTNSEFGFDYLRDNVAQDKEILVQRGHNFALIDEVDSILIDESRTPLIMSMPSLDSENLYEIFARISSSMIEGEDYTVDEKQRAIHMTDAGIEKAEKALNIKDIYSEKGIKYVHHLEIAVRAKSLFHKDKEYVVRNGEVVIVDQFTGRLQPGRRYSEGIHQAIEAKEGVSIKKESKTAASITYQNYFRMYDKLSGMTGTAKTSKEEFFEVYGMDVISIPTNKPIQRKDNNDLIFQNEIGKWKAIARRVKEVNKAGQPVLIGTISIERSELLSDFLKGEGVRHTILNAKNHEKEGEIIADAGKKGAVTIATNMAGRGIDIRLGGALSSHEEYEEIKSLGGLYVLGTERHEARRIDDQLRGRSGRQGDPGETQFFVSLDDDLMRIFGSDRVKSMMGRFGVPEDEPIQNSFITRALKTAQTKIEGLNYDARKHVLEYDNVLNHQRTSVYKRRREMLLSDENGVEEFLKNLTSELGNDAEKVITEKRQEIGEEKFLDLARRIILYATDVLWTEHLETMDYLRSSVNLRAYGQREPIVEYKREGLRLYNQMEASLKEYVLDLISKIDTRNIVNQGQNTQKEPENIPQPTDPNIDFSKVGRNDPCPCGSGKKYKKCHGAN
ncbi:MAG: preprotein translocase subunit SecA [Candidatus Nomurabacteria bacterium]|nr:MAG: preprotein translocase subunit SecA [Candidatus Nomurabacteria bacterium]